jgi:hypothetical protein
VLCCVRKVNLERKSGAEIQFCEAPPSYSTLVNDTCRAREIDV